MTELEIGIAVAQAGSVPAILWAASKLVSAAAGLVSAWGHAIAEVTLARKGLPPPMDGAPGGG